MKKRVFFLFAVLALCVLVTACGLLENYKDLDLPDVSGMELEKLTASKVTFSYPSEDWTVTDDSNPAQLFYNDTLGGNMQVNVTVSCEGEADKLTKSDLALIKTQTLGKEVTYMNTREADLRMLDGEKVIYLHLELKDKDAYIDFLMDQLGLSEKDLDAIGGREALRAQAPDFSQIMLIFIRDGRVITVCGTYTSTAEEKDVLRFISAVYDTLRVR